MGEGPLTEDEVAELRKTAYREFLTGDREMIGRLLDERRDLRSLVHRADLAGAFGRSGDGTWVTFDSDGFESPPLPPAEAALLDAIREEAPRG